jgi:hypothetical protein
MHLSPERTLNRIRITGYKPPITETSKNFEQISHIPARLRPPPAKITAPEQENYQTPHHLGSIQDSKTPHPLSRYLGPQKKISGRTKPKPPRAHLHGEVDVVLDAGEVLLRGGVHLLHLPPDPLLHGAGVVHCACLVPVAWRRGRRDVLLSGERRGLRPPG